ncbi:MAG: zinc metalloprotease [Bacteroidetes bacterium]|nr:zinc metalloprotease [Bacteroidota bacterium]
MNKLKSYFVTGSLLFAVACSDPSLSTKDDSLSVVEAATQRQCGAMTVLNEQLAADPSLQSRMDAIENHTQKFIQAGGAAVARINAAGKIEIPVIVNVLYRLAEDNISDAQIQSQIDVLNEDYNATNTDVTKTPALFSGVVADVDVQFVLAGVNRKYSSKRSWRTNDAMKKTSQGGLDPTDPAHNLNLWVVNNMGSILGYAQFPGGSPATDGVVIAHNYFGRVGVVSPPYHLGRTASHEVGHWMNLRHIWGDANCGNDFVSDTPVAQTSNFGCPSFPHVSACGTDGHAEMTMNYMDYTDDACMYMFSKGQKDRMLAIFASGGARAPIGQ